MIKSYKDLDVWQKGIGLVKEIYLVTQDFPKEEMYGLISQLRRSAVSVPSNIAEGFMRQYTNEMVQFLYIALGSCGELDTQLRVAKELDYVNDDTNLRIQEEVDHIARMTRNLIKSLKTKRDTNSKPRITQCEPQNTKHEERINGRRRH